MKTMKVLILGGEAVGVVDGGCELVEVPVVGGNESELGFKPGFLGAVDSDLGLKGLDHMKVPFEGGAPVGGLGRLTQDELYRASRGDAVDVTARFGYEPGVPIKIVAGGAPVTVEGGSGVDYKAEVRAYLSSVPEGGALCPGFYKLTDEDDGVVYPELATGGVYLPLNSPDPDFMDDEDYEAAWYFLRLDLKSGGVSSPAVDQDSEGKWEFALSDDMDSRVKANTFAEALKAFGGGLANPLVLHRVVLCSDTHELMYTPPPAWDIIRGDRLPASFMRDFGTYGVRNVKIVPKQNL